jgi:hypothetical protein
MHIMTSKSTYLSLHDHVLEVRQVDEGGEKEVHEVRTVETLLVGEFSFVDVIALCKHKRVKMCPTIHKKTQTCTSIQTKTHMCKQKHSCTRRLTWLLGVEASVVPGSQKVTILHGVLVLMVSELR